MDKYIKDFYGRVLGRITTESNGRQVIRDFYGKVLAYYYPDRDVTTDFSGRVVAYGNVLTCFLDFNPYKR